VVAASDVIPLRAGLAALAAFQAGQLLAFAVQRLDLPAQPHRLRLPGLDPAKALGNANRTDRLPI